MFIAGAGCDLEAIVSESKSIYIEFRSRGGKASQDVALMAIKNHRLLEMLIEGAAAPEKKVKNAAAKALRIVSEMDPETLYPRLRFFVRAIDGEETILKWIGMDIVGNLSFVDREKKIDKRVLDKYFALLADESLVSAAHAVDNLWKIAVNKPRHRALITEQLLEADSVKRTADCWAILAGKVILAFGRYFDHMRTRDRDAVIAFAQRQLDSPKKPTRKKAEAFLERFA